MLSVGSWLLDRCTMTMKSTRWLTKKQRGHLVLVQHTKTKNYTGIRGDTGCGLQ